ncbi:MAG: creatininase family protein [Oscillospiraceae bacterium]|nr:creatininase family protein [Oscillospiraceae bacterium]
MGGTDKVMYEELVPQEFRERIEACPIAYLPVGTLEWHGEQNPYGTDAYIGHGCFVRLARRVGGIVFPMLFMGPDTLTVSGATNYYDQEYDCLYGMDHWTGGEEHSGGVKVKEPSQLEGSAYWISDDAYNLYIEAILRQLKRAGFKAVVVNGHGPSVLFILKRIEDYRRRFGIDVFHCWGIDNSREKALGPPLGGHGGIGETSFIMALRPELVQMGRLTDDMAKKPVGVGGEDPRTYASREIGEELIDIFLEGMEKRLTEYLAGLRQG